MWEYNYTSNELYHHGVIGMRWGVRRYQNADGSLTPAGYRHYYGSPRAAKADAKYRSARNERIKADERLSKASSAAYIPTAKNIQEHKDAQRAYHEAAKNEYRSKFEAKTTREAARIKSKNIEFKDKSKHRLDLEAKYQKLGLSKKDAEAAANNRIRTERLLTAAAAITLTACAAYAANKIIRGKVDGVIKAGEALQRIEMQDTGGKLHDVFYVAKGKHDMQRYKNYLGLCRAKQTGHAYMMKLEAAKDIKVASKDNAAKAFKELWSKDADFRNKAYDYISSNFQNQNRVDLDPINLLLHPNDMNNKTFKKMYENFNVKLVEINQSEPELTKKFYDKLKSSGYGAIQDVNDMKFSGYKAKNPLIVFDNASNNISVKSVSEMSQEPMAKNFIKEQFKVLGEEKIELFMEAGAPASAGILGIGAAATYKSDPSKDELLKNKKK